MCVWGGGGGGECTTIEGAHVFFETCHSRYIICGEIITLYYNHYVVICYIKAKIQSMQGII